MTADDLWMSQALDLAAATNGLASPNPQVGCVLVRDGQLLGEGAHIYDLRDHAEIVALKQAAALAHDVRGATAFVTLEPCSHHGRTGPCADALIAAGIARCVVATADPNRLVSGRGLARLRAADIQVTLGVGQTRARSLNNAFAFAVTHDRPFVTLKAALSVDGHLAPAPASRTPGQPFWLTGPAARAEVQRLRHRSDAILTGIGTVLADDPQLTDRSGLPRRRPLQRILLDTSLRLPLDSRLATSIADDLQIFTSASAEHSLADKCATLRSRGARIHPSPEIGGHLDLHAVLQHLHADAIRSVLVEAGSALNAAFLTRDLVDEVILFYSETELGSGAIPFAADAESSFALEQRLLSVSKRALGPDVEVSGVLHNPWPID